MNELNLSEVELFEFFSFMCVAANASKMIYMAYFANIERFLYHSNLFILNIEFYMHVNSPA